MKKRRIVIVAFLLCACMVIGVGYAAVSRNLLFKANISVGNSDLKVIYDEADPFVGDYNDVTYTTEAVDGTPANNFCLSASLISDYEAKIETKKMTEVGQTAIAIFRITNEMAMTDVSISHLTSDHSLTGGLDLSFFTISHEFRAVDGSTGVEISTDKHTVDKLPSTQSVYLIISITVAKEITADLGSGANLVFTASYQATSLTPTT